MSCAHSLVIYKAVIQDSFENNDTVCCSQHTSLSNSLWVKSGYGRPRNWWISRQLSSDVVLPVSIQFFFILSVDRGPQIGSWDIAFTRKD